MSASMTNSQPASADGTLRSGCSGRGVLVAVVEVSISDGRRVSSRGGAEVPEATSGAGGALAEGESSFGNARLAPKSGLPGTCTAGGAARLFLLRTFRCGTRSTTQTTFLQRREKAPCDVGNLGISTPLLLNCHSARLLGAWSTRACGRGARRCWPRALTILVGEPSMPRL